MTSNDRAEGPAEARHSLAGIKRSKVPSDLRELSPIPLSRSQERLLRRIVEFGEDPAARITEIFVCRGTFDVAAFSRSIREIVKRHDILRTAFDAGPPPSAWITDAQTIVSMTDLGTTGLKFQDWIQQTVTQPLSVDEPPLLRVGLCVIAPDVHAMAFVAHELVCDGWSIGRIIAELRELYPAFRAATPPRLAPLPQQFQDVARRERERGTSMKIAPPASPVDASLRQTTGPGRRTSLLYSGEVFESLIACCRRQSATEFMALLAILWVALAAVFELEETVIACPVARRSSDTAALIGPFASLLLIPGHTKPADRFGDLLQRARDTVLSILNADHASEEALFDTDNPALDGRARVLLAMEPGQEPFFVPTMDLEYVLVRDRILRQDIAVTASRDRDSMEVFIDYRLDTVGVLDGRSFIETFDRALRALAMHPDRSIAAIGKGPTPRGDASFRRVKHVPIAPGEEV